MKNRISLFSVWSSLAMISATCTPSISYANNDEPIQILTNPSVMADERLPDFSYAGYNHGIGEIPAAAGKIIDVTDYGVTADDNIDDSKAMLEALQAAHDTSGPVIVQLPKGQVIISDILKIKRSNIVLRGAGSGAEGTDLGENQLTPIRFEDNLESTADASIVHRICRPAIGTAQ